MYLVRNVVAMEKTIQRTFFPLLRGSAHQAILLVVSLTAGMVPVTCQTVASSDSLGVIGNAWSVEYMGTSNQSNRYFLASSAIQSKQGQGHYQTNVAMHSVSYSVSDRITAGAMVGFFGVWLTAKARWQAGEKTSVGLGGLGAADFFATLRKPLALGFINVTQGDDNKNITFSVGCTNAAFGSGGKQYYSPGARQGENEWYGFYYPESEYRRYPRALMLSISGMVPMTNRRWLITENYFVTQSAFPKVVQAPYNSRVSSSTYLNSIYTGDDVVWPSLSEDLGILSLGVRSYIRRSDWFFWDCGLAAVLQDGEGFPVPWFSFTLEF